MLTNDVYSDPQQTRDIEPMLGQCWTDVVDGGPTLIQHCFNIPSNIGSMSRVCWVGIAQISMQPRAHLPPNVDELREKISTLAIHCSCRPTWLVHTQ